MTATDTQLAARRLSTRLAQLERREKSIASQRREAVAEGLDDLALALSGERRLLRDRLEAVEQEIRDLGTVAS